MHRIASLTHGTHDSIVSKESHTTIAAGIAGSDLAEQRASQHSAHTRKKAEVMFLSFFGAVVIGIASTGLSIWECAPNHAWLCLAQSLLVVSLIDFAQLTWLICYTVFIVYHAVFLSSI